jgi:hypothetical protein
VVTVTGGSNKRVSLAALIAVKPGHQARLIYRVHAGRPRGDRRKGFTETDYARLLDAAHQQLGGPLVVVWDNLNTHVSRAMRELVAARPWLTVFQLPPYASELNPVESVWSLLKRSLANLVKRNLSLDPPVDSGRPFPVRFLHEEFSGVSPGAGFPPLACSAACPGSWLGGGVRGGRWGRRGC